ncbi:MAG TPA: DNA polymerase Y family protein [Alphaproteobacteria bacterium]|nr:DNA polymerase Y family protein [Alphaproteobacteria bacterium]
MPRLATDLACRRRPERQKHPLATVEERSGRAFVSAVDARAASLGIVPGQPLADARALVPELATVAADPAGDLEARAALADWCTRFTPWTALDGEDGVLLDLTGCAHLFGGEAKLRADLEARLAGFGIAARAAIAGSPGTAWAMARYAHGETARFPEGERIVPSGAQRAALAPLPVAGLRLPADTVAGLQRMGLGRIGDLYRMPRGPLARRFGPMLAARLDQALGTAAEPISLETPRAHWRLHLPLAEPIARREDIVLGLERLMGDLCLRLADERMGARRLELALYRVDASVARVAVGTSAPARVAKHLLRLFAEKLDGLDAGFGVDLMILAAPEVETLAPSQIELAGTGRVAPSAELGPLVDRLANRLGAERVFRLAPVESHWPERAAKRVAALGTLETSWPRRQARPLRLFAPPEPIIATAPVPDDPPVQFTWRKRLHRVRAAEGPERIAIEWWRPEALGRRGSDDRYETRDYYRVEDEAGVRFWLYRAGAYRPARRPSWYLHGLFA